MMLASHLDHDVQGLAIEGFRGGRVAQALDDDRQIGEAGGQQRMVGRQQAPPELEALARANGSADL
jgi:hypothetical protein